MTIEDTLRRTYDDHLGRLDLPPGDASGARRTGTRMRTRRRLTAGAVAATVVAVALAGVVDTRRDTSVQPSAPLGHWRELPIPPLSPRAEARVVWSGSEVIVLGGTTDVCPPGADCASSGPQLRDGAAYNPTTNSWRAIPPAPVALGSAQMVVADGVVVLEDYSASRTRWFTYEPDHNRWFRIRQVPRGVGHGLSAVGTRVYVSRGRGVAVYDVRRFHWSLLPPDRIQPLLTTGTVTATSSGPVMTGVDTTQPNDGTEPSLLLADVWDGRAWRRLPPSDQLEGDFTWTGQRLVDPSPFTENGGEVNGWGRDVPQGGTLDPATGEWGRLPSGLTGDPEGWSVSTENDGDNDSGGGWFAVAGQVYDDSSGRVYTLDRPDGAPDVAVAGAWAGDRLLAFGGTDSTQGFSGDALTNRAWLWTP
jgi:hypothetical protein